MTASEDDQAVEAPRTGLQPAPWWVFAVLTLIGVGGRLGYDVFDWATSDDVPWMFEYGPALPFMMLTGDFLIGRAIERFGDRFLGED